MSAVGEGLGRVLNVVYSASGLDIPLTRYGAVTFIDFLDAGTQSMTFTQTDSTAVNSEIDLEIFQDSDTGLPAKGTSKIYAGPAIGEAIRELHTDRSVRRGNR